MGLLAALALGLPACRETPREESGARKAVAREAAAGRRPPSPDSFLMSDSRQDGTPDFLRLDSESDRRAFRLWFTFLAESLFVMDPRLVPREVNDCAALLRFAYREALRDHNGRWASELNLPAVLPLPPVRKHSYPYTPLGPRLFRTRPGPFEPRNLNDGAFREFADANHLRRFNTRHVSRDIERAERGDLLFYRQLEQNMPYHVMIFMGPSHYEQKPGPYVVYHTGPMEGGPGELRRPAVEELMRHPEPRWRPLPGNDNFLGVYRWNILEDSL